MSSVGNESVKELLSAIASPREPLAGGFVAALACAEAAALLQLTATLAAARLGGDNTAVLLAAKASALQSSALTAAEREKTAYSEAIAAGDAGLAADTPLAIAQAAAEVAEGAAEVASRGNWAFTPDAVAAAVLAESAAAIAMMIVAANLCDVPSDQRISLAREAHVAAASAARRAQSA